MKLGELKQYVMQMCEDYASPPSGYDEEASSFNFTDDEDYESKLIVAINGVFSEISAVLPLIKTTSVTPIAGEIALPALVKQVKKCEVCGQSVKFILSDDILKFAKSYPMVELTYQKIPTMYFSSTPNATVLEYDDEVCGVAVYGVCADLLKISGDYEIFEAKYQSRLARLYKPTKIQFVNLHERGRNPWR
ncbi:MAG: hypothetical protein R3Y65_00295 [Bacillota bacterium]